MLKEHTLDWTAEWRMTGRKEGRKEGEAALLLRQLEWKFGPLDQRIRRKVRRASADRLLEWGERVLTAESLAEVFGG